MVGNDTFQMPTQDAIDGLVRLGTGILVATNVGPISDFGRNSTIASMKMPRLIGFLLENKTQAVDLVALMMGKNTTEKQVVGALTTLEAIIPHLRHDIRSPAFYISALMIPTVCIALRLYVRKFVTGKIRFDDWFSLAALVSLYICMAAFSAVNRTSLHIWDMSFHEYRKWWIVIYLTGPLFNLAHFFVKITFLAFYYSLSPARWYRWSIYGLGVFVTCFSLSGILSMIFQCRPINFWEHLGTAKCLSEKNNLFAFGIIYIITDFMILFLPVTTVWKLQLRKKEKFIVISIFGMMAFICVVSINRLIAVLDWFNAADVSYKVVDHGPWAAAELDLSLAISCLPAIKVLFPKLKFGYSTSGGNSNPNRTPGPSGTATSGRSGGHKKGLRLGGAFGRGVAGLTTLGTVGGGMTTITHEEGGGGYNGGDGEIRKDTSIIQRYESESNKSQSLVELRETDEIEANDQLGRRGSRTKETYEMV